MQEILKLPAVFGLGIIEIWGAIPAGLAMGLSPFLVWLAAGLGALSGVVLIAVLGKRVRSLLLRGHFKEGSSENSLIYKAWKRYGAIGLGLFAPVLIGAPLGTALGIVLGVPVKRLILWMSMGIILWDSILTVIGWLGAEAVKR